MKKKEDIDLFILFLKKDISKRIHIDKKHYFDNNECHLKHLNFILMEILLYRVLLIYQNNFDSKNDKDNQRPNILYVPDKEYEKDLTIISRELINNKYLKIDNDKYLTTISRYIYNKYKSFEFINLNFLKRKIYQII